MSAGGEASDGRVAVVDYGAGNLHSVGGALDAVGASWFLAKSVGELEDASAVLLPGVGSAGFAMRELERRGFAAALREPRWPLFGICLGLQLLFEGSEEDGGVRCLGVFPGRTRRLAGAPKLPHMGWNRVDAVRPHPLWGNGSSSGWFYFAHSFVCAGPPELALGETTYGETFVSAVARENVWGVQFHPEKSGEAGLRVLAAFCAANGLGAVRR